jgi:hypothetical protein
MQLHRKPNTVSTVYGAYPTNAKRAPTFRTKQLSWDAMSQSPCPGRAMDRRGNGRGQLRTTPEECLEGEHLKFKAHIRGWNAVNRERRCQSLLAKTEHSLRKALLSAPWKDILLVPQDGTPSTRLSMRRKDGGMYLQKRS